MSVRIMGAPALRRRLAANAVTISGPISMAALLAAGKVTEEAAKANVKAQMRTNTGGFLAAITTRPSGPSVIVGSAHPGAAVQEFGATIVPRTARMLRFEVDGQVVFTKRSVVPARPWLRPAADQNRERMLAASAAVASAAINRMGP